MDSPAMSELVKAYEATLDKGVTGILALLAVALVVGTLAYFWTKRTSLRAEVNKGQTDQALVDMFAAVLEQHRSDSNSRLDKNTTALDRNVETREKYTSAFTDMTYAVRGSIEAMERLKLDVNSRQGLVESTMSDVSTRVQTLIGAVSTLDTKFEQLRVVVTAQQADYPQITAAIGALTAEMHQTYELMIDTLRPPNHTLKTTNTPEGEAP